MKILADQNMPLVEQFFKDMGEVERFDGRQLTPEQLIDVDVLLTRSVTQVNSELLAQTKKPSILLGFKIVKGLLSLCICSLLMWHWCRQNQNC